MSELGSYERMTIQEKRNYLRSRLASVPQPLTKSEALLRQAEEALEQAQVKIGSAHDRLLNSEGNAHHSSACLVCLVHKVIQAIRAHLKEAKMTEGKAS